MAKSRDNHERDCRSGWRAARRTVGNCRVMTSPRAGTKPKTLEYVPLGAAAEGNPARWLWRVLPPVALALVVAFTYGNSLRGALVLDSSVLVLQDVRLRELSGENLRLMVTRDYWWPTYASDLYRPLTTLSFALNYHVVKGSRDGLPDPLPYHLTNMLLHWLNAWLVYGLLARHLRRYGRPLAMLGAAIYAVHPLNTEVVANVAGRADLLVTFFILSALALHAARDTANVVLHVFRMMGIVFAGVAAVLCKENAVLLVPLMVLEDLARMYRDEKTKPSVDPLWQRAMFSMAAVDYLGALPSVLLLAYIRNWLHHTTLTFDQVAA